MNLKILQSRLLEQSGVAKPTQIQQGIQGDKLQIGVLHRRLSGSLDLLTGGIQVWEDIGKIQLNGRWSFTEIQSISKALEILASTMEEILKEEDAESEASWRQKEAEARESVPDIIESILAQESCEDFRDEDDAARDQYIENSEAYQS